MKYVDEFRDPRAARALRREIDRLAAGLANMDKSVRIMEVCGTHTMAIARSGIRQVLPANVDLRSGPGCPVCVTDPGYIDAGMKLARKGVVITTFGDMLNVPGSDGSLTDARAEGADVRVCYSPSGALDIAEAEPDKQVVFLAIGFETTIAPIVSTVDMAAKRGAKNFSILTAFKVIPPALRALLGDGDVRVDAFICPAHVSAIIGSRVYEEFSGPGGVPCVVAGFEPLDILMGIRGILEQLSSGDIHVDNQYNRVVRPDGNTRAKDLMAKYLQPCDGAWRGMGVLPESSLELKSNYRQYDATVVHAVSVDQGVCDPRCMCGDVVGGRMNPEDCGIFGTVCNPGNPVGPCMVSSEGACAAHYRYLRRTAL